MSVPPLLLSLRSVLQYRGFIIGSLKREFQSRYLNSALGNLWALIQPLAMIAVYAVVFSEIMHAKLEGESSPYAYSIYLCSGMLTWGLFAEILSRGQNMFLEHATLLKKVHFPRVCLPLIVTLSALMNFAIIFFVFTVFLLITGAFPGPVFFALTPVLSIVILIAMGLGITLGVLNVFFRDVGQFFTIFLQFWFWLTPVVYPLQALPLTFQSWIKRNPITPLIQACHQIVVLGVAPTWSTLVLPFCFGLMCCGLGWVLFRQHSGEMVDEL
jgi:lipopolysaccharide transport system permease protein